MILSDRSFYVIEHFEPISHLDLGRYAFNVGIEMELAKKAFQREIDEKMYNRFQEISLDRMKETRMLKRDETRNDYGYHFLSNKNGNLTLLLRFIDVPGNACDLGINGEEGDLLREGKLHDKFLGYYQHNIDGQQQAYTLLSLWLTWVEAVKAICEP